MIKQRLRAEGFSEKWRNADTIQRYIRGLPPYPALSSDQEGFRTRSYMDEEGRTMNVYMVGPDLEYGTRDADDGTLTADKSMLIADIDTQHADKGMQHDAGKAVPGAEAGLILYLHGGAYFEEILPPHFRYARQLAGVTGRTVVVPNYPTLPAVHARELVPYMQAFYAAIRRETGQPITIIGDSAGAALALAIAAAFRFTADAPARLVLLSPWADVAGEPDDPELAALAARDVFMQPVGLREVGRLYADGLPLADPRVSPFYGEHAGLPETLLLIGTEDILLPDARRLRDKLRAAGVAVDYREYADMMHVWPLFPMPEAEEANRRIAAFLCGECSPGS